MKWLLLFAGVLGAFLSCAPAQAARHVKNQAAPTGSIAVDPSSDLRLGGIAIFDVTVADVPTSNTSGPAIAVDCYQNGAEVYGEVHYQSDFTNWLQFTLGGSSSFWLWDGGNVNCTATLGYWDFTGNETWTSINQTTFDAGA